ncbi:Ig-like domain-containing protein [Microbulbifer sp. ANSA005]|uniref:Ig-like domain-containing protein n=1 Tax=Microbulbifer sp. ANSA005 TaxID=3243362 RepID=UPI0040429F37
MEGKFFKADSKFIKAALVLAISSAFYGCSGGSGGGGEDPAPVDTTPPSLTLTPASGASIAATGTLLLDFSEAVALEDVSLSGAMQEMGEALSSRSGHPDLNPDSGVGKGTRTLPDNCRAGCGWQPDGRG